MCVRLGLDLVALGLDLKLRDFGGKAYLGHEVVQEIVEVVERFGVVGVGQVVEVSLEAG